MLYMLFISLTILIFSSSFVLNTGLIFCLVICIIIISIIYRTSIIHKLNKEIEKINKNIQENEKIECIES